MKDTLKKLELKRKAVTNTFNDLYDTLQIEEYESTIKKLKQQNELLQNELDSVFDLLIMEIEKTKEWKKQAEFMTKVKTITVKN